MYVTTRGQAPTFFLKNPETQFIFQVYINFYNNELWLLPDARVERLPPKVIPRIPNSLSSPTKLLYFFLVGLRKPDNIVKLKSAVGYNEEKLSNEIVNDINTGINVLGNDIAKKQDQHPRATSGIPDNQNRLRILTTATALVLHLVLNLQLLTIRPLSQTLSTRRLLARRQVSLAPLRAMTGIPTLLNQTTYLRRAMRRSGGKICPFLAPTVSFNESLCVCTRLEIGPDKGITYASVHR